MTRVVVVLPYGGITLGQDLTAGPVDRVSASTVQAVA